METQYISTLAGAISTLIFAASNIPMLRKAFKARDLRSYSLLYLIMSNTGNVIHWLYIGGLPFGPIWFLHAFYTIAMALMLLRYVQRSRSGPAPS
jgi:hypothetical protein